MATATKSQSKVEKVQAQPQTAAQPEAVTHRDPAVIRGEADAIYPKLNDINRQVAGEKDAAKKAKLQKTQAKLAAQAKALSKEWQAATAAQKAAVKEERKAHINGLLSFTAADRGAQKALYRSTFKAAVFYRCNDLGAYQVRESKDGLKAWVFAMSAPQGKGEEQTYKTCVLTHDADKPFKGWLDACYVCIRLVNEEGKRLLSQQQGA